MDKKYELLENDTITVADSIILYRIRALHNFNDVKAGDLGGYIQSVRNLEIRLNTINNAWIYDNATVYENACVYGNARICGNAKVFGDSRIFDNAWVYGKARVSGTSRVFEYAKVFDNAWVQDDTRVFGNASVFGDIRIFDRVWLHDYASANGGTIRGDAHINSDAIILNPASYTTFSPIGSRYDTVTFFRTASSGIWVNVGCFSGNIDTFKKAVKDRHCDNKFAKQYYAAIPLAESILCD